MAGFALEIMEKIARYRGCDRLDKSLVNEVWLDDGLGTGCRALSDLHTAGADRQQGLARDKFELDRDIEAGDFRQSIKKRPHCRDPVVHGLGAPA